ncbi:MAG: hypothetical protein QM773_18675 [Hyphomonadaceae bacterium]
MIPRSGAMAALALLACGMAAAQDAPAFTSAITQHEIKLQKRTLSYSAEAGLMPIRSADGSSLIADMSYVAYSLPAKPGVMRPVAFIWNGGSGANTTPLHYGAFGPKRLAGNALKANEGTLLDVADLVFIDQTETGFGRYAPGVSHRPYLNQPQDARAFGTFIETWLRDHGGAERPTLLIGESYGVKRAQLVTEDLMRRGIEPEALVLISGYSLVGKRLEPAADGAFRLPGYAALAFRAGIRAGGGVGTDAEAHDAALVWSRGVLEKSRAADPEAAADLAGGLKRFFGYTDAQVAQVFAPYGPGKPGRVLAGLASQHAPMLFAHIDSTIAYDTRKPTSDNREWISQAIVDDLRKDLGLDPKDRKYVGQEFDQRPVWLPAFSGSQPMKVSRADGTVVELSPETAELLFPELKDAAGLMTNQPGIAKAPADGLAASIVNMQAHFGVSLSISDSPMPELMEAAPKLQLFVIGGMYDDLVSCAVGEEMARRDLPDDADRIRTKCYAGGHMMYEEERVAVQLSADVRDFIKNIKSAEAVTP